MISQKYLRNIPHCFFMSLKHLFQPLYSRWLGSGFIILLKCPRHWFCSNFARCVKCVVKLTLGILMLRYFSFNVSVVTKAKQFLACTWWFSGLFQLNGKNWKILNYKKTCGAMCIYVYYAAAKGKRRHVTSPIDSFGLDPD